MSEPVVFQRVQRGAPGFSSGVDSLRGELSEGRSIVTLATSNRSPLTAQTGDPSPVLICGVPWIGVWRPVSLESVPQVAPVAFPGARSLR